MYRTSAIGERRSGLQGQIQLAATVGGGVERGSRMVRRTGGFTSAPACPIVALLRFRRNVIKHCAAVARYYWPALLSVIFSLGLVDVQR